MTITQEAARGLRRACVRMVNEMEWCAAIVGDPMYAGVKHDYRAKLRDLVAYSRTAIAKATPRTGHAVTLPVRQPTPEAAAAAKGHAEPDADGQVRSCGARL